MYGQTGPMIANLINNNMLPYGEELLSEIYDKSMSNFQRIFVDNHIDNIHTIINPVICNSKHHISSTISLGSF